MSRNTLWIDSLLGVALFGLALWLRQHDPAHFVTADEHNWVFRSGLFLNALIARDWSGTSVWYTPAVTTTWLGSAALAIYYQLHQADINQPIGTWLTAFSRNKIDLDILLALRWAMILTTAAMSVVIFSLARRLWDRPVALLGTLLLITEPHLLAVSRIIGHDALITLFTTAALLSFLYARRNYDSGHLLWFVLAGVWAALAILSKAPALILLPFIGLVAAVDLWLRRASVRPWLLAMSGWGLGLLGAFIVVWPAAWLNPIGQAWTIISSAFLSSAGLEDADIQPYWSIPDPGVFYYLLNGAFKVSPSLMVGTLLAGVAVWLGRHRHNFAMPKILNHPLSWLALFTLLFTLMMTLGVKRSPRYILPVFPALSFIAAWGWLRIIKFAPFPFLRRVGKTGTIIVLGGLSLLLTWSYAPYYFSYYNPLLGGGLTAPHLVRVGWGEGLDEVGRWLNGQASARADQVGARYTVALHPYYQGRIVSPVTEASDYVVSYIKQSQSGYPAPEILAYFEQQGPLYGVRLNGIEYAQIYRGPGMIPVAGAGDGTLPVAYRADQIYAPIGGRLTVDLLWPASSTMPSGSPVLHIESPNGGWRQSSEAAITTIAEVRVSKHSFELPADLPRETYQLRLNDQRIGQIKARRLAPPPGYTDLDLHFADQLRLIGYRQQLGEQRLTVELAWQAWPAANNDFTAFVQLLDESGGRVAGVDITPEPGFTSLDRKEVMVARYDIPLPADIGPGPYTPLVGLYYFAGADLINVGSAQLSPVTIQSE